MLTAAWAMRHTLFKVLVCLCLGLLFFLVLIVSLPSIVTNSVFGLDGNKPIDGATLLGSYTEMAEVVDQIIEDGYDQALAQVEDIITSGGYDYDLSMDALTNYAYTSAGYDVCYILAAYSASMEQKGTSKADMERKLSGVVGAMFPVTKDGEGEQEVEVEGEDDEEPSMETVKFVKCTIHPFDNAVIATAFGLDLDAEYGLFGITYKEAIENMAAALKRTLYGSIVGGQAVPLTDAEFIAFVNRQNCSAMRKYILSTALSLVGKVPYFWGGKSAPGWNEEWNTPRLVTAAQLQPGDLGFLGGREDWTHVLIFAGYGESGQRMWVHSSGGEGVILNTPSYEGTLNLRRPKYVDFDGVPPAR